MNISKTLLLVFVGVMILGINEASAQRGLKGQVAVGVNAGTTDGMLLRGRDGDYCFFGGLEIVRYNRNRTYWNFGGEYLRKDYPYRGYTGRELVPLAQFTGEAGYNIPILSDRGRNIALVGGIAGVVGYELTHWGEKRLNDGSTLMNDDTVIYGAAISATIEGYISDRVVVLLRVRERCLFGSSTGKFHTQIGFGFRFIIN